MTHVQRPLQNTPVLGRGSSRISSWLTKVEAKQETLTRVEIAVRREQRRAIPAALLEVAHRAAALRRPLAVRVDGAGAAAQALRQARAAGAAVAQPRVVQGRKVDPLRPNRATARSARQPEPRAAGAPYRRRAVVAAGADRVADDLVLRRAAGGPDEPAARVAQRHRHVADRGHELGKEEPANTSQQVLGYSDRSQTIFCFSAGAEACWAHRVASCSETPRSGSPSAPAER